MTPAVPDTPPPLQALERVLAPAAALRAARALGVLDVVSAGGTRWQDAGEVAGRCDLDPHRAGVLLAVLADAGLVERGSAGYRCHEDLARLGDLMQATLGDLPAAMARDRIGGGPHDGLYPGLVGSLGVLAAPAAERAAASLATPGAHVLDLGAGAAPWSLAILRREPTARLTAVDRPEVLAATRAAIGASGVGSRASVLAADVRVDPLPDRVDLVLLAHVLHLFDADGARGIVARGAASLAPRGRLAIVDVAGAAAGGRGDGDGDAALRRYELGLFARAPAGRLHELDTLRDWCAAAGLERHEVHDLGGAVPMTLLIADGRSPSWCLQSLRAIDPEDRR